VHDLSARPPGDAHRTQARLKEPHLEVVLRDVHISSCRTAPGSVDAVPLDVVGLDCRSVLITFTAQNPDGSLGTPVTAGFDFVKNLGCPPWSSR
jgi:hypothetical protein